MLRSFRERHHVNSYIKVILITGHEFIGIIEEITDEHIALKLGNGNDVTLSLSHVIASETINDTAFSPSLRPPGAQFRREQSYLPVYPSEQKLILLPKQDAEIPSQAELNPAEIHAEDTIITEYVEEAVVDQEIPTLTQQTNGSGEENTAQQLNEVRLEQELTVDGSELSFPRYAVEQRLEVSDAEMIQPAVEAESNSTEEQKNVVASSLDVAEDEDVASSEKQASFLESATFENTIYVGLKEEQQEESGDKFSRLLTMLEKDFQQKIQDATINIIPPDFQIPSEELKPKSMTLWNKVKNRYDTIKEHRSVDWNEKISKIIKDVRELEKLRPKSSHIKRHLAYFYTLIDENVEALRLYREAFALLQELDDLHNIAVLSTELEDSASAYMALEKLFHEAPITENLMAWYTFIKHLQINGAYRPLENLWHELDEKMSDDEYILILQTVTYLLKYTGKEFAARDFLQAVLERTVTEEQKVDAFKRLSQTSDLVLASVSGGEQEEPLTKKHVKSQTPSGYIFQYKQDRGYGFLRDTNNQVHYFRLPDVLDPDLLAKLDTLKPGESLLVVFESRPPLGNGPSPRAIKLFLHRSIHDIFTFAERCARDGKRNIAIEQMRKVLDIDPGYPGAEDLLRVWREQEQEASIPKGTDFYVQAKRASSSEEALAFYDLAIQHNQHFDSAVKDKAHLLSKLNHEQSAVDTLLQYRNRIKDQRTVDNLLIEIYYKMGNYQIALEFLEKKEKNVENLNKRAACHLQLENYAQAEQLFRDIIDMEADNRPFVKKLALCLIKQERYIEAEDLLKEIIKISPNDNNAKTLLDAAKEGQSTGQSTQLNENIADSIIDFDNADEIGAFASFFLEHGEFKGVPPAQILENKFDDADRRRVVEYARQHGNNAGERAIYYLSAAKIVSLIGDEEDFSRIYRYLFMSFSSFGEAAFFEKHSLDAARTWYSEALNLYKADPDDNEKEANKILLRFLCLLPGLQAASLPANNTLDVVLRDVLQKNQEVFKALDDITYLATRSLFARERVLGHIQSNEQLRQLALRYLQERCGKSTDEVSENDDLSNNWNLLMRKMIKDEQHIATEILLVANFEFSETWLENTIRRLHAIQERQRFPFKLDQTRIAELQNILERALEFCKESVFEPMERLCKDIEMLCQKMLKDIEKYPTRFSIEHIYRVIIAIQDRTKKMLEQVYTLSEPNIVLDLPWDSYPNKLTIDVHVSIKNDGNRCSPAKAVEIYVVENNGFFSLKDEKISLGSSLIGNESRTVRIPLTITQQAIIAKVFPLRLSVQYRTHLDEIKNIAKTFSIRLEDDFEQIENPYARYAESNIVDDQSMFYGRSEMIARIAKTLCQQNRSFIIYGQKRAGKSSILHHLKEALTKESHLLILKFSMGEIVDTENSDMPLFRMLLWKILLLLKEAVEIEIKRKKRTAIKLPFLTETQFFKYPVPLNHFINVFSTFKRAVEDRPGWRNVRIVLMIDEFQYIHDQIVKGRLSEDFMKNWKALLELQFFSAVLVGQDVITKFKKQFPNEFGTTQDERVSYLKIEDAKKLIDEPIRIGGKNGKSRYRGKAIDYILALTAGSPFYIQIICNRLVEYMNEKNAKFITEADVEEVERELIKGVNSLEEAKFDNLTNSGDTSHNAISKDDALKVLRVIALNSKTVPCSRGMITSSCQTQIPIGTILDDLVHREVLTREQDDSYTIRVGLFKKWLIAHP